jgi:DNA-binding transcriptional LysR family regulator
MDIDSLKLFVRAHERGSISAAARDLDWLPATASAALMRAERDLGGVLFARTTRSLKATPQGLAFLERARRALALLDEGRELFLSDAAVVKGLVRLSAPSDVGQQVIQPALDDFLERHQAVSLSLQLSDEMRDIGRDDFDAGIRYGRVVDPNLIVRKLAETRRVLVAAPAYLERHGVPTRLDQLRAHECILLKTSGPRPDRWRLFHKGKANVVVVEGRRLSDNGATTRRWAIAGHGIALKAWLDIAQDVAQGRLVRILPGYASESYPLTLAMSSGVRLAARMRALGAWLTERLTARVLQFPFPDAPKSGA